MAGGGALKKLLKRQKLMIDGKIIQPGDKVTTGKGEEYLFDSISRYNETEHGGNSSGKIILRDPTVPEGEPFSTVQYYPSVVGGKLVDPTTTLKRVKRRGGRIRKAKGGKISRRDLLKGLGAGALAAGAGAAGLGKAAVKQGLPEVPIAAVKKALHRRPTISKSWFPKEDWDVVNRYIKKYINDLTDDLASRNPDIDEFPMVLDDELQTLQRIQNLDYSKSMDPFDERYFRNFLEDVTGSIEDDIGRIDAYQNIGDQRYTDYHQIEDMLGEIDEFDMRRNIWDEDAHTVPTNRAEFAELVGSKVEKAGGGLIRKGLKQYQKGPGLHEAAMEAAKAGDADKALEYLKQLQDILQLSDEDFSKMLGAQFDRGPQSSKYVPEVDPDLDAPIGGYKADQRDPDSRMRKAGGGPIDKSIRGALVQAQEAFAKRQGKVKSPDIEIPEGFDSFYTKQYSDRVDIIGVTKDGKEQIVDNIGPGFGDLDSMVLAKELASIYNTGGFSNAYVSRPKLQDLFPPEPPPPPKASVTQIRGGQRAPEGNRLRSFQEHLQNLTKTGNVGVDELQDLSDVAREALSPEDFEIFLEQLDGDGLIPPSQGTRQVPYEPDVTVQMGSTATELKKILAEMGLSPEDLQDPATAFRRLAEMSDEMATRPASYKRPLTYEEHLMETPPARMTLDELEDAFDHDFMTEDDYMFFQESFVDLEDDMMDLLKDYHPSGFEDINDIEIFPNPKKENEFFAKVRYLGDDDLYYFKIFEDEVMDLNGPDDIPPRFAEGGEVKKEDSTAMDYLRSVGQSLFGAVPFGGEELPLIGADVGEQIYKKAAYPLAGLASQWYGVNPTNDEFEYAGPGSDMIYGRGRPSYPMEELQMIDPEEYRRQYEAWRDWKGETGPIPGIIDETALLPAMPQMIEMMTDMDEISTNPDYEPFIGAPELSLEASDRAAENWERSLAKFGLPEPEGFVENALISGGMMVGQIPVPTAWLGRLRALFPGAKSTVEMVKNAGKFGWLKSAAGSAPEFLFPTIDPSTANYVTASLFGGGLMTMLGGVGEEVPEDIPPDIASLIQRHNQGDEEATKLLQEILNNHEKQQSREDTVQRSLEQMGKSGAFAGGGAVKKAISKKWRIWDPKEKVWVSQPYSDKNRARHRMDKLDNDYGAYRYQVKEVEGDEVPKLAGGGKIRGGAHDKIVNFKRQQLLKKKGLTEEDAEGLRDSMVQHQIDFLHSLKEQGKEIDEADLKWLIEMGVDPKDVGLAKGGRISRSELLKMAKGGKISRRELLKGLGAGAIAAGAGAAGLGKTAVKKGVLEAEVPVAVIKKAIGNPRDLAMRVSKADFSPVEWKRLKGYIDEWIGDWEHDLSLEEGSAHPDSPQNVKELRAAVDRLKSIEDLADDVDFNRDQKAAVMDLLEEIEDTSAPYSGEGNPDWIELEDDFDFASRLSAEFHTPQSFKREAWKNALNEVPNPSPKVRGIFEQYVNDARVFEDRMEYGIEDLAFAEGAMPGEAALFEKLSTEEAKQLQRMIHASPDGTFTHF